MPIGDSYAENMPNKFSKSFKQLLGTLDLHTHIRLAPAIKFFEHFFLTHNFANILEIGCDNGINAFEINKIAAKYSADYLYTGIDMNETAIQRAQLTLARQHAIKHIDKSKLSFTTEDAITFLNKNVNNSTFDIILLMDIIEHIKCPQNFIALCAGLLKKDGMFVVSVPTTLYPIIFGREFHARIGHLVDGYTITALNQLFRQIQFSCKYYEYNTGLLSNVGCWLFYNKLVFKSRRLNLLKSILLYPFKFLDIYNSPKVSCSIFAIYTANKKMH